AEHTVPGWSFSGSQLPGGATLLRTRSTSASERSHSSSSSDIPAHSGTSAGEERTTKPSCRRRNRQPVRSSGGRVESDNRTRVGRVTLQRMDNVGIVVESLDAAISFFAELGLELEGRATIEGDWAERVTGLRHMR